MAPLATLLATILVIYIPVLTVGIIVTLIGLYLHLF